MNRILALAGLVLTLASLGCSGGGAAVAATLDRNPAFQALTTGGHGDNATPADGERTGGHRRFGRHGGGQGGDELGRKLLEDPCANVVGSPKEGGSATFTNCTVHGGTLSGTVTWSGNTAGDSGLAMTNTKQVTYVKSGDAEGGLPEMGKVHMFLKQAGIAVQPVTWDRAEVQSNIKMSGTKGERESFSRTGTTTISLYNANAVARTIQIVWDAPRTVTITIDGDAHVIDLATIRDAFKARRDSGEGRGKHHGGKAEAESATPSASDSTSSAIAETAPA
ncbi:MAG: hypothetical protein ABI743_08660 [bacterium]